MTYKYKVDIVPHNQGGCYRRFENYAEAENFYDGAKMALSMAKVEDGLVMVTLAEIVPKPEGCSCPIKKNDGSPFDGVSYYCPLHGR
jgi:hypothetical protein